MNLGELISRLSGCLKKDEDKYLPVHLFIQCLGEQWEFPLDDLAVVTNYKDGSEKGKAVRIVLIAEPDERDGKCHEIDVDSTVRHLGRVRGSG